MKKEADDDYTPAKTEINPKVTRARTRAQRKAILNETGNDEELEGRVYNIRLNLSETAFTLTHYFFM